VALWLGARHSRPETAGKCPKHEEYDELAEWAPPGFDAEAFDVEEATEMMRSSRPLLDW